MLFPRKNIKVTLKTLVSGQQEGREAAGASRYQAGGGLEEREDPKIYIYTSEMNINAISSWASQNWDDGELNSKYWLLVVSMYHHSLCIF